MLSADKRTDDIPETKEVYKRLLGIAWPSTVESVLVSLVSMVDSIMVSSLGLAAIAAVGITGQPRMLLLALISSLNAGVTAVISRRKGENNREGANHCLRQSLLLSIILSATLSTIGFVFARPMMLFMGAQADIIEDAVIYFKIISVGIFFTSVSLTLNAAQRGAGNTKISMRTNVVANVINVIFNYLLIGGNLGFPKLGVAGAAIATVLGYIVAFFMSVSTVLKNDAFLSILGLDGWKFEKTTMAGVLNVAYSAAFEQLCMRVGFISYSRIIAGLGTIAYATHQIVMNLLGISFSFGDGLAIASSSLVGQSLGQKRPGMAMVFGKVGQRVAITLSLIIITVCIFGRFFFVGIFTDDYATIILGSQLMLVVAATSPVQTSNVVITGCLRGAGDTKFVAQAALLTIVIIRPLVAFLLCYTLGFGLVGAWVGMLIDQSIRLVVSYMRFHKGRWTKIAL